jgi:hypothetical protein
LYFSSGALVLISLQISSNAFKVNSISSDVCEYEIKETPGEKKIPFFYKIINIWFFTSINIKEFIRSK